MDRVLFFSWTTKRLGDPERARLDGGHHSSVTMLLLARREGLGNEKKGTSRRKRTSFRGLQLLRSVSAPLHGLESIYLSLLIAAVCPCPVSPLPQTESRRNYRTRAKKKTRRKT